MFSFLNILKYGYRRESGLLVYLPLSGYPACCARCICTIHVCVQTCIFTCGEGQKVKNPSVPTQVSIHSVLFEKYLTGSVFLMGKGYIYVLQIKKKEGGTIPQKDSFLLCNKWECLHQIVLPNFHWLLILKHPVYRFVADDGTTWFVEQLSIG